MGNANLHKANKAKNDEFFTQLTDIEKELQHYWEHFRGKVIFCNCDDPEQSNFWKYFELNFDFLGIKKLISTHYETDKPSYKLEMIRGTDLNGDGKHDKRDIVKTPLKQNGDFRSEECVELLKEADVVVSNPPFSIFREYISLLEQHGKKFLVVGNNNAITYKECFRLIKDNKMWLGINANKTLEFRLCPTYEKFDRIDEKGNKFGKVPAISWFTNLPHKKRNEELILWKTYKGNEKDYPRYDNYFAWEVSKTNEIPLEDEIEVILNEDELAELEKTDYEFEIIEEIKD